MTVQEITYDEFHLNAPVPNLETEEHPASYLEDDGTLVTNEMSDGSASDDDEISLSDEGNDSDDATPAEVSYESDNEQDEDDEPDSSEAEMSEDDGFDDSDYESECTLDYPPTADDDSVASFQSVSRRRDHELFLPRHMPSEYEPLKNDADDDSEDEQLTAHHRTYMTTRVGFRPRRMMMLMPPTMYRRQHPSNISDDSSEDEASIHSQNCKPAAARGVSFDNTVTVHPIFDVDVYSDEQIENMYTKREELRVNKIRNKREYAYDDNDWENATEECDMTLDEDGKLVHPVHKQKRPIWTGGVQVHRAKRMRMYYP